MHKEAQLSNRRRRRRRRRRTIPLLQPLSWIFHSCISHCLLIAALNSPGNKMTSSLTFPEWFKENKPTQEDSERNKEHADQQRQWPLTKLRRRLRQHLSGRHPAGGNLPWWLSRFQKLAKVHTILLHQLVHHLAQGYSGHGFPILQLCHGGREVDGVD